LPIHGTAADSGLRVIDAGGPFWGDREREVGAMTRVIREHAG
jgi:hypothetical protein